MKQTNLFSVETSLKRLAFLQYETMGAGSTMSFLDFYRAWAPSSHEFAKISSGSSPEDLVS